MSEAVAKEHLSPLPLASRPNSFAHPLTRLFRHIPRLTLLVLAAGLLWRCVRYGLVFPIWGDEAMVALNFFDRDFAGMLRFPLDHKQIAPLPFMWIDLALAKTFGYGELVLRLPAFLAGVGGLVLFWRFSRRLVDRHAAMLGLAILAASHYVVRHGAEIKPYTIDMLVALSLTSLAWWVGRRPGSAWRWIALTAVAAVGVWFSLPAGFIIAGVGCYLLLKVWPRRSLGQWSGLVLFGLAAAASFAAMYLLYAGPLARSVQDSYYGDKSQWNDSFLPIAQPWRIPWWLLKNLGGNMMAYPQGAKHLGSSGTLLLVIAGSVSFWRTGRRDLLLLLLGPMAAALAASALKTYPFGASARTMLYLAPAICLLAGEGLRRVLAWVAKPPRRAVELIRFATLLLMLFAVGSIGFDIAFPYHVKANQQERDYVESLAARTAPGDQWVVANSPQESNSDRIAGSAPILAGQGNNVFQYQVLRHAAVPCAWGPEVGDIPSVTGRTWVMYYEDGNWIKNHEKTRKVPLVPGQRQRRDAYLQALTQRFGQPKVQQFKLECDEDEHEFMPTITTYEFGGS